MRVLVTGASGFVGQALCAVLRSRHTVYGTSRRAEAALAPGVSKVIWAPAGGGLLDPPHIDAVVHLAARVHVMHDDAADPLAAFRAANVDATLALARWAAGQGVKRFVFMSTAKVNGETTSLKRPFCADDTPAPLDAYAVSKWEAECGLFSLAADTGMQVVVIRPPLVYGPGVKGNFASLVSWVRHGVPMPLGAVDNRRSLVALDNLVDFAALCADPQRSPSAANEIFLVGDGDDLSTAELLRRVACAYGVNARLLRVPVSWLRIGARVLGKSALTDRLLDSLIVDVSKARERLGWMPVVTMEEQLRKMAINDGCI